MFTQALADTILQRLSDGMSLRKACDATGMPAASTILRWASGKETDAAAAGFPEQYADARMRGYMLLAEEIIDISDRSESDVVVGEDGVERTNAEVVARSRLMVDTRKWLLSKMLPKTFGDKLDLAHSGRVVVAREMTDDELMAHIQPGA